MEKDRENDDGIERQWGRARVDCLDDPARPACANMRDLSAWHGLASSNVCAFPAQSLPWSMRWPPPAPAWLWPSTNVNINASRTLEYSVPNNTNLSIRSNQFQSFMPGQGNSLHHTTFPANAVLTNQSANAVPTVTLNAGNNIDILASATTTTRINDQDSSLTFSDAAAENGRVTTASILSELLNNVNMFPTDSIGSGNPMDRSVAYQQNHLVSNKLLAQESEERGVTRESIQLHEPSMKFQMDPILRPCELRQKKDRTATDISEGSPIDLLANVAASITRNHSQAMAAAELSRECSIESTTQQQITSKDSQKSSRSCSRVDHTVCLLTKQTFDGRKVGRIRRYNEQKKAYGAWQDIFVTSSGHNDGFRYLDLNRGGRVGLFTKLLPREKQKLISAAMHQCKLYRQYTRSQVFHEPRFHVLLSSNAHMDAGYMYHGIRMKAHPIELVPEVASYAKELARRYKLPQDQWNIGVDLIVYKDGEDSIGWHADDTQGESIVLCVVVDAPGEPRPVCIRPNKRCKQLTHGDEEIQLNVGEGMAYDMNGRMQSGYEHSLPKKKTEKTHRFCLIFRHGEEVTVPKDSGKAITEMAATMPRRENENLISLLALLRVKPPPVVFGHPQGVIEGSCYSRRYLFAINAHRADQRGVNGNIALGSDSIVVSRQSPAKREEDGLQWLRYTSSRRQGGGALCLSHSQNLPLRVFRSSNLKTDYAPPELQGNRTSYRYDGLYVVTKIWDADGNSINNEKSIEIPVGGAQYTFHLERLPKIELSSVGENSKVHNSLNVDELWNKIQISHSRQLTLQFVTPCPKYDDTLPKLPNDAAIHRGSKRTVDYDRYQSNLLGKQSLHHRKHSSLMKKVKLSNPDGFLSMKAKEEMPLELWKTYPGHDRLASLPFSSFRDTPCGEHVHSYFNMVPALRKATQYPQESTVQESETTKKLQFTAREMKCDSSSAIEVESNAVSKLSCGSHVGIYRNDPLRNNEKDGTLASLQIFQLWLTNRKSQWRQHREQLKKEKKEERDATEKARQRRKKRKHALLQAAERLHITQDAVQEIDTYAHSIMLMGYWKDSIEVTANAGHELESFASNLMSVIFGKKSRKSTQTKRRKKLSSLPEIKSRANDQRKVLRVKANVKRVKAPAKTKCQRMQPSEAVKAIESCRHTMPPFINIEESIPHPLEALCSATRKGFKVVKVTVKCGFPDGTHKPGICNVGKLTKSKGLSRVKERDVEVRDTVSQRSSTSHRQNSRQKSPGLPDRKANDTVHQNSLSIFDERVECSPRQKAKRLPNKGAETRRELDAKTKIAAGIIMHATEGYARRKSQRMTNRAFGMDEISPAKTKCQRMQPSEAVKAIESCRHTMPPFINIEESLPHPLEALFSVTRKRFKVVKVTVKWGIPGGTHKSGICNVGKLTKSKGLSRAKERDVEVKDTVSQRSSTSHRQNSRQKSPGLPDIIIEAGKEPDRKVNDTVHQNSPSIVDERVECSPKQKAKRLPNKEAETRRELDAKTKVAAGIIMHATEGYARRISQRMARGFGMDKVFNANANKERSPEIEGTIFPHANIEIDSGGCDNEKVVQTRQRMKQENMLAVKQVPKEKILTLPRTKTRHTSKQAAKSVNFHVGEKLYAWDKGVLYEAKVLKCKPVKNGVTHHVHYLGYKKSHDRWLTSKDMMKKSRSNRKVFLQSRGYLPRSASESIPNSMEAK